MLKGIFVLLLMMTLGLAQEHKEKVLDVKEKTKVFFEKTTWRLVSFGNSRMAVPEKATIRFEDGHYSGNGGCNGVGGNYVKQGESLSFEAGFSTMMACDVLDLEHKYVKALSRVNSFNIQGLFLELKENNITALRFRTK